MASPTHGKICYLEVPASKVAQSASFYAKVFGWRMRTRGNGTQAFDDTTGAGAVSGSFVVGRAASTTPGLLVYIMVDSVEETCRAIEANGGTIVQPLGADAPELTARFRDPGGNVLGVYQEPTGAS
jgi:uncharacterized protein